MLEPTTKGFTHVFHISNDVFQSGIDFRIFGSIKIIINSFCDGGKLNVSEKFS